VELNQVYFEDCMETMARIPDGEIDMILQDPPYNITVNDWDVEINLGKLWGEWIRIAKENAAIVFTAKQPFATDVINSKRNLFRYEYIWHKTRLQNFVNANKMPLSAHENILVFYRRLPTYNPQKYKLDNRYLIRKSNTKPNYKETNNINLQESEKTKNYEWHDNGIRNPDSVLNFNSIWGNGMHPTQKPLPLFKYLVKTYTNKDEVVFDGYMGRGTTAVAAYELGRKFIGSENNKKEYKKMRQRLDAVTAQMQLL